MTSLLKWLRLGLSMTTLFIVIHYLFQPSENQCQMTFMMEPPRFVPIPVGETSDDREYSLFMYRELGFPLQHGTESDMIDSMPVLFVPGNAGSYQQVRSLASTCIRRQLQSLDALKFVFYTIDFGGQLSGLSGDLVGHQVRFVHSAVRKIIELHPTETNGIIVIGHSVGGFIAKALSTVPNFEPKSISLIINLASPLIRPNLIFDRKLNELYTSTECIWSQHSGKNSSTLSISISGGTSDRLVPVHLSLDPQYDLSITSSSIDDVWLTTDHVSITWCRELINKVAMLMSALMDKKRTKLIEGKEQQMTIVKSQLITSASDEINVVSRSSDEQATLRDEIPEEFSGHFLAHRDMLMRGSVLLNMKNYERLSLLFWIEHIEAFESDTIFGCRNITLANGKSICNGKINLANSMRTIPSPRYELKKKMFFVRDNFRTVNYLVLDYPPDRIYSETKKHKIPESISVQDYNPQETAILEISTLLRHLYKRLMNPTSLVSTIEKKSKQLVTYLRYELVGLNDTFQFYSIKIEPNSCETIDKQLEMTALLHQDLNVMNSFHLTKGKKSVLVKLNSHKFILFNNEPSFTSRVHLDVIIRGPCGARLEIELDLWRYLEAMIQYHSSDILILAIFLSSISVISHTLVLSKGLVNSLSTVFIARQVYPQLYFGCMESSVIRLLTIFILASGLIALVGSLTNRLIDLATIILRFQHFVRTRVSGNEQKSTSEPRKTEERSARKAIGSKFDHEWLIIVLITGSSFMLSVTFMKLYMFFLLLKQRLDLSAGGSGDIKSVHSFSKKRANESQMLISSLTTLCAIGLICYIPTALLKINEIKLGVIVDPILLTTLGCLVMIKLICSRTKPSQSIIRLKRYAQVGVICSLVLHSYVFSMIIDVRDIRDIIYVEFLMYAITILSATVNETQSKRKTD